MRKYSNLLLSIILILVLLNLGLTGLVMLRQVTVHASTMNDQTGSLESSSAQALGEEVSNMYNQQDHHGLYDLFHLQAKKKISHLQLQNQLKNLFQLFGKIEKSTFARAEKIGEKGDELYYNLFFNIRVNDASKQFSKLTLVVVKKHKKLSLYGIRINANYSLD